MTDTLADPTGVIFEKEQIAVEHHSAFADAMRADFQAVRSGIGWFMWLRVSLFIIVVLAALVTSFTSVYAMSSWIGIPPEVQLLPAIFLDVAIIASTFAMVEFRRRDRYVGWGRAGLAITTCLSVVANATHTLAYWKGDLSTYQAVIGIVFSAAIPLITLLFTEILIRLIFDPEAR
ncbi:hypothetical protein [Agromyces subbeticus]|uniref:hypothetical protein n=1 Tax=Agromyces subbeticus TaxID=293890 RepID=UPI0003B354CF|nr:hypothetical protein [Agromyces subbeticus]